MPATTEVEVWVIVDSDGSYAVASDNDSLAEKYEEDVGDCSDASGLRRIKVTLTVPLPEVVEIAGTVSALGEPCQLQTV